MRSTATGHRKTVKHFDLPGQAHELTFSCYRRMPLLAIEGVRPLLSDCVDRAMIRHRFRLLSFVFMQEHVHLLVFPQPQASKIDRLLNAIKRPLSFRVKQRLQEGQSPWLGRLIIRQRHGVRAFRLWQEGPGYDRNFYDPDKVTASIDYIHRNPVKRGLCEHEVDWPWSSARRYCGLEDLVVLPRVCRWPSGVDGA